MDPFRFRPCSGAPRAALSPEAKEAGRWQLALDLLAAAPRSKIQLDVAQLFSRIHGVQEERYVKEVGSRKRFCFKVWLEGL